MGVSAPIIVSIALGYHEAISLSGLIDQPGGDRDHYTSQLISISQLSTSTHIYLNSKKQALSKAMFSILRL